VEDRSQHIVENNTYKCEISSSHGGEDDSWWWRQYAPLKRRSTIILHGSTTQKTALNIILTSILFLRCKYVSWIKVAEDRVPFYSQKHSNITISIRNQVFSLQSLHFTLLQCVWNITSKTPTIYLSYDLLLCFLMIGYSVKLVTLWRGTKSKEAPWSPVKGHSRGAQSTLASRARHSITAWQVAAPSMAELWLNLVLWRRT
jgi:hypothetical protein